VKLSPKPMGAPSKVQADTPTSLKQIAALTEEQPFISQFQTKSTPSPKQTEDPTTTINQEQLSTSGTELTTTMGLIEAVWEARMNAHISDRLAEHEIAMDKKFDALDAKMTTMVTQRTCLSDMGSITACH